MLHRFRPVLCFMFNTYFFVWFVGSSVGRFCCIFYVHNSCIAFILLQGTHTKVPKKYCRWEKKRKKKCNILSVFLIVFYSLFSRTRNFPLNEMKQPCEMLYKTHTVNTDNNNRTQKSKK